MTITGVDFHVRDDHGRILALVEPAQLDTLGIGQVVAVEDFEGNRLKATVGEIFEDKHVVALNLDLSSFDPSSKADWIAEAINY